MKMILKRTLCIAVAICLLACSAICCASPLNITEKSTMWDFEDKTMQGWTVDRPADLGMSIQPIAGSNALKLDYRFNDKTAQTWWDTCGITMTSKMDLSEYDAVTMDVILDLSAVSGYGYLGVEPCFNTLNWESFYHCEQFHIYNTPEGVGVGELSKITVVCEIPEEVKQVEQMIIWFVGGAIDYSGPLYVDNIGFVKGTHVTPVDVDPITPPHKTPVEKHGQLQVIGTQLCGQDGEPVQLRGMFTSTIGSEFINRAAFQAMAFDWKCDAIRLCVDAGQSSFENYDGSQEHKDWIYKGIDLAIETGMYVIVDWHQLTPGNPNDPSYAGVDKFFDEVSKKYADCPNVIYEICNEPNGNITWENDIKPYAERLRDVIRRNDPDNIIIIGTGTWSQDVDIAAMNPVAGDNLMYTFHFYCGSHNTWSGFPEKVETALKRGIAIFVTEWGVSDHTGAIGLYFDEADRWLEYLDLRKISWINFVIGNSGHSCSTFVSYIPTGRVFDGVVERVACPLTPSADSGKGYLYWPEEQISPSGKYIKNKMLEAYVYEPRETELEFVGLDISGALVKGESVSFAADAVGGAGRLKYAYYIFGSGKMYYMNADSAEAAFSYVPMQAGEYTVAAYCFDSSGHRASLIKEFTVE